MCPVCLPRYSPSAFLHAYVAFLHPGAGLAVALLAATADAFESLAAGRQLLEAALNAEGVTQVPTPPTASPSVQHIHYHFSARNLQELPAGLLICTDES